MTRQADWDAPPHIQDALDALAKKAAARKAAKRKAQTKFQARRSVARPQALGTCGGVNPRPAR